MVTGRSFEKSCERNFCRANKDQPVHKDLPDLLVLMALLVLRDPLDQPDQQDLPELMVLMVLRDPLDLPDQQVLRERTVTMVLEAHKVLKENKVSVF